MLLHKYHLKAPPTVTGANRTNRWVELTLFEINRTHKRALRALYGDYESTFEDLLDRDKSKTIHKKNPEILLTEDYRTINHLNPEYM